MAEGAVREDGDFIHFSTPTGQKPNIDNLLPRILQNSYGNDPIRDSFLSNIMPKLFCILILMGFVVLLITCQMQKEHILELNAEIRAMVHKPIAIFLLNNFSDLPAVCRGSTFIATPDPPIVELPVENKEDF
jgi:hypothetical protein